MGSLYQEHHEEDFFLYIAYSDESVYGFWTVLAVSFWPKSTTTSTRIIERENTVSSYKYSTVDIFAIWLLESCTSLKFDLILAEIWLNFGLEFDKFGSKFD